MGGALADTRAFPEQFVLSVATAEAAGSLDAEMGSWATLETERASDAITRASLWLPKVGYCVVVAFVIYRIFAMVGGYYQVMQRQFEMMR
jgi:type II secretory pathway component PulF